MGQLEVDNIETAKNIALTAHRNTGEAYCVVNKPCGRYWVTRKRYAKKIGAATVWDTVGRLPRAKNSDKHWSDAITKLLIDTYAENGARIVAARTGKTLDSVRKKAIRLGLKRVFD